MPNHTIFLLNKRNKKLNQSIKQLRDELLANQVVRITIGETLRNLKQARSDADREGEVVLVGELHRYVNALRKELARQEAVRRQTVSALTMLGEHLVLVKERLAEELADVFKA